jgi:hypothetical protein
MLCFAASYRLLYRSDLARMRRNAGSLFVTQCPKANPPMNTATPASRLLNRLKPPTGEPGAKKALAGVAAGTGIAVLAVNVLSWLLGV